MCKLYILSVTHKKNVTDQSKSFVCLQCLKLLRPLGLHAHVILEAGHAILEAGHAIFESGLSIVCAHGQPDDRPGRLLHGGLLLLQAILEFTGRLGYQCLRQLLD